MVGHIAIFVETFQLLVIVAVSLLINGGLGAVGQDEADGAMVDWLIRNGENFAAVSVYLVNLKAGQESNMQCEGGMAPFYLCSPP